MDKLGLLFLSSVLACSGGYKTLTVEKPSPCYYVEKVSRENNKVKVYLSREKGKLCAQVIVKEKIKVEKDVKEVEVILNNRVWKKYKITEESHEY